MYSRSSSRCSWRHRRYIVIVVVIHGASGSARLGNTTRHGLLLHWLLHGSGYATGAGQCQWLSLRLLHRLTSTDQRWLVQRSLLEVRCLLSHSQRGNGSVYMAWWSTRLNPRRQLIRVELAVGQVVVTPRLLSPSRSCSRGSRLVLLLCLLLVALLRLLLHRQVLGDRVGHRGLSLRRHSCARGSHSPSCGYLR